MNQLILFFGVIFIIVAIFFLNLVRQTIERKIEKEKKLKNNYIDKGFIRGFMVGIIILIIIPFSSKYFISSDLERVLSLMYLFFLAIIILFGFIGGLIGWLYGKFIKNGDGKK